MAEKALMDSVGLIDYRTWQFLLTVHVSMHSLTFKG